MKLFSFLQKTQLIRFAVGWMLFGVFFIAVSTLFLFKPRAELVATDATVVEIVEQYDSFQEETVMTAYIDYEAEGIQYKHVVSPSYSYSMKVGSVISVFYDKDDPELLSSTDSDFIVYIALAVGVLCVIGGGLFLVKNRASEGQ